ncbi:MAG: type IV secretion system DNA-binding domain-containing protein [Candidatus Curtissbacteria bacterium]|nr:type IV secretion system DNA-binding domain-containing protein [Candidatus Curtissbacteria bacterium]
MPAKNAEEKIILEIKIPRESEETPESFASLLSNLTGLLSNSRISQVLRKEPKSIALEIACFDQSIHFFIIIPTSIKEYIESQITAQYPVALMLPQKDYLSDWLGKFSFAHAQLVFGKPYYYPIRTFADFKDIDPLSSVLATMSKAKEQEVFLVQFIITAAPSSWQRQGYSALAPKQRAPGEVQEQIPGRNLIQDKISKQGLKVSARILTGTSDAFTKKILLDSLAGSFGSFSQGEGNYLKLKKPSGFSRNKLLKAIFERKFYPCQRSQYFNTAELASLYHFPSQKLSSVHNISWGTSFASEPPENLPTPDSADKENINFFARTNFKNKLTTFGLKLEDRRRHTYIVGKTGTGKSTLIANMVINDIRNNRGVAVIDPHGDLSEILLDYIPSFRVNDVVYLNPSDKERSFVLNPLEVKEKAQKELAVSGIIAIFQKIYAHTWGPRLEHILRNTLFTLTEVPDATFMDISRFLTDATYRNKYVAKTKDPVIYNFWKSEFDKMDPRLRSEAISPILNKVGQFLSAGSIRNVVGRPHSTIDLEEIMNTRKILILNLSQGKLGEDSSSLLGAMFITKLQLAAMNRVNMEEEKRKDFFLYVDEFQNFATTSFIKILSEARKYRLNLTLANQYMAQVSQDVEKAIMGNTGNLLSFIVGADDANILSKEYGEVYKANDLTSLDRYQMVAKLTIDNHISRSFLAYTLPLPNSKTQNRPKVLQVSADRYTKPV